MTTFNTFSLSASTKRQTIDKIDRCCSLYYVTMASIYNVAQSAMVDALACLKEHPKLYRHDIKLSMRNAMAAYDRWDKAMRRTLKDRYQLWLDLSDAVDDDIRRHVQMFRQTIDSWLLRYGIPDRNLLAHLETALSLVRMARMTFDNLFANFDKVVHVNLRPLFQGGDFRDVEFWWERGTDAVFKAVAPNSKINLNESHDVDLAFKIIARKLTNEQIFNRAGEKALLLNPDTWGSLDKEDRLRLKKGIPLSHG